MGGNLTYERFYESEGSFVIAGNVIDAAHSIAGKVLWGLGYLPPANATMMAVGGNLQVHSGSPTSADSYAFVGGNTRIGGSDTSVNKLFIASEKNFRSYFNKIGQGSNEASIQKYTQGYVYPDQKNAKILTNLGKTNALKVDADGDGVLESDFNDHVNKTLKPLSTRLRNLAKTGTITYEKAPDDPSFESITGVQKVSIANEGRIVFTGDGQNHRQVFNLDLNQLDTAKTRLKVNGWSLDFRNIPDSQAIIVNATGKTDYTWNTGWRVWVNGKDYSTGVGTSPKNAAFKDIASRLLWNYPDATQLTLDLAYFDSYTGSWRDFTDAHHSMAVMFPGSILLPNGSMYDLADTNGRLLIGKNLRFNIWEHHNAPWIGLPDTPQCFSVKGTTTATLS
ncbi:choice-of-anchor A family protein [Bifidobacterium sp. SO1]|uniref:choice-of-anchor A family protein n=1 Tax=Bifidobacterium sp. SO1 TaxID=2809029 RepID=UPI001BDCB0CD|nr:choice-of-anchor A family protein [Bifidobacterium sp. SO1]